MELSRHRCLRRASRAAFAALACGLVFSSSAALADSLRWARESNSRSVGEVRAVALDAGSATYAFADEVGVSIRAEGAGSRRVLRIEGVEDLSFDDAGSLWVGAAGGLWRIAGENLGRVGTGSGAEDRSAAPGASARHVHRIAHARGWFAAATEAGLFVSSDGQHWQRIAGAAPAGATSSVALACEGVHRCEVWWVAGSALWRSEIGLTIGSSRIAVGETREIRVAGAPAGVVPVDIALGLAQERVVVLYPRLIAAASMGSGDFRIWRPVLPPGGEARRIAYGLGRYWLATDRGLMLAAELGSTWRRAGVPAGWLAAWSVAIDADRVFVGTASGIVRSARSIREADTPTESAKSSLPVPRRSLGVVARPDMELGHLHRLAFAHLSLDPARQRGWRQRADRRSGWPEVDVRLGYGGSLDRGIDEDQAFVSSAKRQLNDRDRDRGDDWDASLSFKWDLPEAIFDGEVLDVAREERLWISLRDDVLDEINQLYFERRRVMLDLEAIADPGSMEAERLRLRAEELAAGLDAWTGGAFRSSESALDHPRESRGALDWQPGRADSFPSGSRTE